MRTLKLPPSPQPGTFLQLANVDCSVVPNGRRKLICPDWDTAVQVLGEDHPALPPLRNAVQLAEDLLSVDDDGISMLSDDEVEGDDGLLGGDSPVPPSPDLNIPDDSFDEVILRQGGSGR
ncbi:hypothetical protein GWK47_032161 [Chionoecetes opilio]|uniref:Uncharacterized protein n=1 Tax=Chionoecetes opilio TaxID=41210 RepID=A0A8J5D1S9_CHIOP|nr:hypothetical protein GWK47_032161 [Chionoecetes opilio]